MDSERSILHFPPPQMSSALLAFGEGLGVGLPLCVPSINKVPKPYQGLYFYSGINYSLQLAQGLLTRALSYLNNGFFDVHQAGLTFISVHLRLNFGFSLTRATSFHRFYMGYSPHSFIRTIRVKAFLTNIPHIS